MKPKLTSVSLELDRLMSQTAPGMAHWAGTGPEQTTCRECQHYKFNGYKANRGVKGGLLKDGNCVKYAKIMGMEESPKVPFESPSCKYFDRNPKSPPIVNPRKDR